MTKQRLTIAEIQARLIGKSATEVFGWVNDLDGSIVLGDGMSLDSLGLTIDSAGTIQKAQDSSGNRKVTQGSTEDPVYAVTLPPDNSDAEYIIPGTTSIYQVLYIRAEMTAAAVVAARAFKVKVIPVPVLATPQTKVIGAQTDEVALTTGEQGKIFVTGNDIYYNDDGTITHGDNTIFPLFLYSLSEIIATATNKNAADRIALETIVRKVG